MTLRNSERARAPGDADALAELLRQDTASSEDMARMEASLGRAMRQRPQPSSAPRFVLAVTGLALAAAAIFWLTRPTPAPQVAETSPAPSAPAPRVASLQAGSSLTSGEGQLQNARLAVTEGSLAVVDDDALAHATVTLARGEIRVAFHPEHRGEEHLAIVTDVARVEVVGTEFVVTRREDGSTHVSVSEGVVRVIEIENGALHELRAGSEIDVGVVVAEEAEGVTAREAVEVAAASIAAEAETRRRPVDRDIAAEIIELEDLENERRNTDPASAIAACDRILALDPAGSHGSIAIYERGTLHERMHDDAAAAEDFALYLSRFPGGSFAAQAQQHLCALDPSRCSAP